MASCSGDGINAAGVKRMAFQQAFACHAATLQDAVFQDCLGCVNRARGIKPAARTQKRRNNNLIHRDSKVGKISNRMQSCYGNAAEMGPGAKPATFMNLPNNPASMSTVCRGESDDDGFLAIT